jgi:hypothetical protein
LKAFARRLKPYLPGILAHCRWPLGTNLIEGINNRIKVIKRMAYGFRDDAYFFLKIRAAFPGNRWRTKKKPAGRKWRARGIRQARPRGDRARRAASLRGGRRCQCQ